MAGGVQQPHLICGDFNSPPLTPAYHVVTEGYLDDGSMSALQALTKVMLPDGKVRVVLFTCGLDSMNPLTQSYFQIFNV